MALVGSTSSVSPGKPRKARRSTSHRVGQRLLTVSIAIPVSLLLISAYHLRIIFGLLLSILAGLELQSNFEKRFECRSSLHQKLLYTLPSMLLLLLTAGYGRWGFAHGLFLTPFVTSCGIVLVYVGDGVVDVTVYHRFMLAVFQCFYIGGTLAHASFLNDLPYAMDALLYTIVVTCVGEASGLFGGMMFGRHHVSMISRGKTLEGYLSTIICSIATSMIYERVRSALYSPSSALLFPPRDLHLHTLAVLIAVMASMGDLVESLIKRGFSVKDMGHILPGMGGILDRIDALLYAFPTTYYYLLLAGYIPSTSFSA